MSYSNKLVILFLQFGLFLLSTLWFDLLFQLQLLYIPLYNRITWFDNFHILTIFSLLLLSIFHKHTLMVTLVQSILVSETSTLNYQWLIEPQFIIIITTTTIIIIISIINIISITIIIILFLSIVVMIGL